MATIEKQPLTSMNITEEQLLNFKQLFPEVFTEGLKVDWDKLRLTLGETVDTGKERYGMNWPGKADCFKTIQQPSIATLVPARDESIDFDTTENLFIEGDNLEVLKLLQKSYLGKVKMIYIDPPYNTGNDFIYPDDFAQSMQNYMAFTGQVDAEGRSFSTNKDTNGRFHSDWLNMLYPRLFLAKNLLQEDGVIFISIDDHEIHNLKALCNEVFGEENFVECLKWKRKKQPSFLARHTAKVMEYILVYSKNYFDLEKLSIEGTSDSTKKVVNLTNQYSERLFKAGVVVKLGETGIIPKGKYQIKTMIIEYLDDLIYENGFSINKVRVRAQFSVSQDLIDDFISNKLLFITINKGLRRDVSEEEVGKRKSITDLLLDWGDNQDSDNEMKDLFGMNNYFDYTKPSKLVFNLTKSLQSKNSIILDFFAGSATTAHAVMELNKEDGGNRKFICVQIPEPTDEKSEAYKAGYKNIAEISKERIRRVSTKIKTEIDSVKLKNVGEISFDELSTNNSQQSNDLGFKVFKLDKSNFKTWDATLEKEPEAIQARLFDYIDHISPEAAQESILYELLLKSGFELTTPIDSLTLPNGEGREGLVFSIAGGQLLICLEKELSHDCIKAMAEMQPTRVICLDEAFTGTNADALKTNAVQIMKSKGVVNFRTV
jgi:adenine-specific DNA-methyltransferase